MTDLTTFDVFEQRIADHFRSYVDGATDPTPVTKIADSAMQPRGAVARVRRSRNGRRLLLLGLAAVLVIPAAYFGSQRLFNETSLVPVPSRVPTQAPTLVPTPPRDTSKPQDPYQAILVRRSDTGTGVSVYAVGPDGQRLLRTVPDMLLPPGHKLDSSSGVTDSGFIWLFDVGGKAGQKPVVVVSLADQASDPWVVPHAWSCCPAPAWGPTGLLAALSADVPGRDGLVIADPVRRITQSVGLTADLVPEPGHDIPDILWTQDGGLFEGAAGSYATRYVDGRPDAPGFPDLFEGDGVYGSNGALLTVCPETSDACPVNSSPGAVVLVTAEGVSQNVYSPQEGEDPILAARFGRQEGEFWLILSHDEGRQARVVRLTPAGIRDISVVDLSETPSSAYIGPSAPDESAVWVMLEYSGSSPSFLAPIGSDPLRTDGGWVAGFVKQSVLLGQPSE